jgi:hypothetical protein
VADFTRRLLDVAVRAAAVDTFYRQLRSRRVGDLLALETAINDHGLWSQLRDFWISRDWITPAPNTPLYAFPGPEFPEQATLREFCGQEAGEETAMEPPPEPPVG